jgi:RluA family pseudouridine synthase
VPRIRFQVDQDSEGQRLDIAIFKADMGLSRRKAKAVIDVGGAYVNRRRVHRASHIVRAGDRVELEYSDKALTQLRQPMDRLTKEAIIFRDSDLIAINKPPGLPSQATRDQDVRHVVPCVKALIEESGEKPPKLILGHRLDKETSGVLMVATNAQAATWLTEAFRARTTTKVYHALVLGLPEEASLSVRNYLSEIDKKTGSVSAVRAGGRFAETTFKVLKAFPQHKICLMECHPTTGRSHQIRVHLESLGYPILGDKRYGTKLATKLDPSLAELAGQHHFLHALSLKLPAREGNKPIELFAPYPESWKAVLQILEHAGENREA